MVKRSRESTGKFYVYVYLDPRKEGNYSFGEYTFDHEPIYVGKGSGRRAIAYDKDRGRLLMNKLGKFDKPIIKIVADKIPEFNAFKLEMELIALIGRMPKGTLCNLTNGGDGVSGLIHSDKTKQLLSEIHIGKKHSKETKLKMSLDRKGRILSEETKRILSEKATGRKHSEETKRIISYVKTGVSHIGIPHTEETKRKISEALSGKIQSVESNAKRSNSLKGRKHSQESKDKMSRLKQGTTMSDEAKLHMKEAWERRKIKEAEENRKSVSKCLKKWRREIKGKES